MSTVTELTPEERMTRIEAELVELRAMARRIETILVGHGGAILETLTEESEA